jgi:hypothetical protein
MVYTWLVLSNMMINDDFVCEFWCDQYYHYAVISAS